MHIQQQCLRDPSDQQLCTEKVDDIIAGFTSQGVYAGARYRGQPACRDMKQDSLCLWGCQRVFAVERDAYGCCYNITRDYLAALGLADVDGAFSHQDTVAVECGRPFEERCATVGGDGSASEITVVFPIPFSFAANAENKTELEARLLADLERQLARPDASSLLPAGCKDILDCLVDGGDDATSKITVTVTLQDPQALEAVTAAYASDVAAASIVNYETLGYYSSRCRGSIMCSVAFVARPSSLVVVIAAALGVLAAL